MAKYLFVASDEAMERYRSAAKVAGCSLAEWLRCAAEARASLAKNPSDVVQAPGTVKPSADATPFTAPEMQPVGKVFKGPDPKRGKR